MEALSGTLANARFYAIDGSGNRADLGGFVGEIGQVAWVPAAAGSCTLEVVATDVDGNTQQATVNVVATASVPAPPQATVQGGLDDTTLAQGRRGGQDARRSAQAEDSRR